MKKLKIALSFDSTASKPDLKPKVIEEWLFKSKRMDTSRSFLFYNPEISK